MRKEALTGIYELLQSHPDLFPPNFSKILLHVSSTLTDDGPQVRHAFCVLLKHLITCATLENMRPFVPIVIAHLICGLTHINEEIQFDSLKVFDLLLAHFPTLLIPDAHKLLPLLVRLISRQKQLEEAAASGGRSSLLSTIQKSLPRRNLTTSGGILVSTPHSRLAELDSRLKIFSQLCSFLEVILNSPAAAPSTEHRDCSLAPIVDVENRRVLVSSENDDLTETSDALCSFAPGIPHVVVLKHHGILPSNKAFLSTPASKGHGQQEEDSSLLFSDYQQLGDFIKPLISLLLESWVECDPATVFNKEAGHSKGKNQALPLMETILNTMCLVLKLVHQSDLRRAVEFVSIDADSNGTDQSLMEHLRQKYWSELGTHLVSHFPFSTKSQVSPNQLNRILSMDFTLCYIMLLLHPTPEIHASNVPPVDTSITNSHIRNIVCSFFVQLHESGKLAEISSAPNAILTLVAFLPTLLQLCCWTNIFSREQQTSILRSIWSVYRACHPLSSSRQSLMKCFSEQLKITFEQNQDHSRSVDTAKRHFYMRMNNLCESAKTDLSKNIIYVSCITMYGAIKIMRYKFIDWRLTCIIHIN